MGGGGARKQVRGTAMPVPSVGRIVHFHALAVSGTVVQAAIVTGVQGEPRDGIVDLLVMPSKVAPFPIQGVGMGEQNGEWSWPERVS